MMLGAERPIVSSSVEFCDMSCGLGALGEVDIGLLFLEDTFDSV